MKPRTQSALIAVFFALLLGLWWAESARLPTGAERLRREGLLFPSLEASPGDVRRVEIDGGPEPLAFARRGDGGWQMVRPKDVLADRSAVDSLVKTVLTLRRRPDASALSGSPAEYGLDSPRRVIRLFGADGSRPLAGLELGKAVADHQYVRAVGGDRIEAVEALPLRAAENPMVAWREEALFPLSSFEVEDLEVTGPGRDLEVRRDRGRWGLVRPVRTPADDAQVEGALAEVLGLRVDDPAKGFVAEGVSDYAPYGLDEPRMTIAVTPASTPGRALVAYIGKAAESDPQKVYARREGQDDVILVPARGLSDLGTDPVALRSKRVAELDPARASLVRIQAGDVTHEVARAGGGWVVRQPAPGPADPRAIGELLTQLAGLQASEFLDPARADRAGLDPPWRTLSVWEAPAEPSAGPPTAEREPAVALELGRHDPVARVIYARLRGDRTVLTLSDALLDALPDGPLGFRDRTVLALDPAQVGRLTVHRGGTTYEVEAPTPPATAWRMTRPVEAPADERTLKAWLTALVGLRAQKLVAGSAEDPARYGLDRPVLTVSWSGAGGPEPSAASGAALPVRSAGTLEVGGEVPAGQGARYGRIAGVPTVFVLAPGVVQLLQEELHERRVVNVPAELVSRIELRRPEGTTAFRRTVEPPSPPSPWEAEAEGTPEPGAPGPQEVELLLTLVSNLSALRFLQYDGPIPEGAGLSPPRLAIALEGKGLAGPTTIRLGASVPGGQVLATNAAGSEGPVFTVPTAPFERWLRAPDRGGELPQDVFAPGGAGGSPQRHGGHQE